MGEENEVKTMRHLIVFIHLNPASSDSAPHLGELLACSFFNRRYFLLLAYPSPYDSRAMCCMYSYSSLDCGHHPSSWLLWLMHFIYGRHIDLAIPTTSRDQDAETKSKFRRHYANITLYILRREKMQQISYPEQITYGPTSFRSRHLFYRSRMV